MENISGRLNIKSLAVTVIFSVAWLAFMVLGTLGDAYTYHTVLFLIVVTNIPFFVVRDNTFSRRLKTFAFVVATWAFFIGWGLFNADINVDYFSGLLGINTLEFLHIQTPVVAVLFALLLGNPLSRLYRKYAGLVALMITLPVAWISFPWPFTSDNPTFKTIMTIEWLSPVVIFPLSVAVIQWVIHRRMQGKW
uniref:hypothetical protein n=1 Tax=Thaumasiovibrio occultus TaxID=1891184 RepID=UPI000B3524AB|nr:hypothetical protein [Thaumasiovibrio occultus]